VVPMENAHPGGCQVTVRWSRLPNFPSRVVSMSWIRRRLGSSAASARSRSPRADRVMTREQFSQTFVRNDLD